MELARQRIIEKTLYKLIKDKLLKKGNRAYAALKKNPKMWKDELKDREELENTLADGLD